MRVLDMEQPIELGDIYTDVNILEKITGRRRLEIDELLQNFDPENFDRFGLSKIEKRVPGLEAVEKYQKLMVLGKPGAGKTTFLKYLAIQGIGGKFQSQRVPIFITLKQFAESKNQPGVGEFISQQLANDRLAEAQISELLNSGRAMILLDGLDEVREEDNSRVLAQIKEFSDQYHQNQFFITCRIAAREYTFEQFTEVEVADFDDKQITDFSTKWFQIKDPEKADKFIQKLGENEPIRELATNPLLLTLLCLVFEESADFPSNRSQLYKEGLLLADSAMKVGSIAIAAFGERISPVYR
jgi:predicted NACHT family NTPase